MTRVRSVVATLGFAAGVYGVVLLLTGSFSDLISVALWFALCVVGHDLVLSPLLAVGGVGARRLLPARLLPPLVFGVVATLALSAVASSVLLRSDAVADNPSLLNRNYPAGFLIAVGLVWVAVVVAVIVRRARHAVPSAPTAP